MPHIPLFASDEFEGKSPRGLYGDVVEEIDQAVGTVLAALREYDCEQNTLVVFTSDNGPWLSQKLNGGSAGLLRAGKGTTFEGGMRVPTIFRWPGTITAGSVITDMGCTTDLMATVCALTGATLPNDRVLDSLDLSPPLLGTGDSPRAQMLFYTRGVLHAARLGNYKLHMLTRDPVNYGRPTEAHDPPLLYDLGRDPGEQFDVADRHPEVIRSIRRLIEQHQAELQTAVDQLAIPLAGNASAN